MLSLFTMTPKHRAEVLSSIPRCKKAVMYLTEKEYVSDKLPSGLSFSAVNVNSILINQQYTLNKISLNKNIHKTSLRIDQFT